MPIQSVVRLYDTSEPPEEIGIRLNGCGKDGFLEFFYAAGAWTPQRLAMYTVNAQNAIDVRIPLDDPSLVDDPAGPNGSDPARPDFFWDSGDLVSRSVILSDMTFTDRLDFTLTRAR